MTAHQWLAAGCRTLDDIREGKNGIKLTPAQQTGLKYYDGILHHLSQFQPPKLISVDINSRMPREEARAIFDLINPVGM